MEKETKRGGTAATAVSVSAKLAESAADARDASDAAARDAEQRRAALIFGVSARACIGLKRERDALNVTSGRNDPQRKAFSALPPQPLLLPAFLLVPTE